MFYKFGRLWLWNQSCLVAFFADGLAQERAKMFINQMREAHVSYGRKHFIVFVMEDWNADASIPIK